jgi:hypothetical protein
MYGHRAPVVCHHDAAFARSGGQDIKIIQVADPALIGGLKINGGLPSEHRPHDLLVEIGVRLKSDFHSDLGAGVPLRCLWVTSF